MLMQDESVVREAELSCVRAHRVRYGPVSSGMLQSMVQVREQWGGGQVSRALGVGWVGMVRVGRVYRGGGGMVQVGRV